MQLHLVIRKTERDGHQRADAADPPGVLLRVVVAVLGREREALEHLQAGLVEIARPLGHLVLEVRVLLAQPILKLFDLKQVAHPQQQLDAIQRLGQEIAGAHRESTAPGLIRGISREHQEGHAAPVTGQRPKPVHELEPIHPRHVEIEQHQIGLKRRRTSPEPVTVRS